jgi:AraC-like DNA-binding protein
MPFLALALDMDSSAFAEMFRELDEAKEASGDDKNPGETGGSGPSNTSRGMFVSQVTPDLLNAFLRLVTTEGDERRIRFISHLILREICFYLAEDENAACLRAFYASSTQGSQIARAIGYMREHCHERLRIETLARLADMAESTFNRNFRRITTLSPLQYHKNLKLHEARRLMIAENMSAAAACYAVGYESQQQFTREYKRLFGCPPMKDARRSQ